MKHYKLIARVVIVLVMTFITSCSESFLDVQAPGVVNPNALNTVTKTEELIIAAYAALGNSTYTDAYVSDYVWGSVRSDDGHKGGSSISDQGNLNALEQYNLNNTGTGGYGAATWSRLYEGIARANLALRQLDLFTDEEYVVTNVQDARTRRRAELLFIRAHFMFIAKRIWKYIPFIESDVEGDDLDLVSNRAYTNDELWDKIAADFQFGVDNLPLVQAQPGRPNRWAAKAYLAKVRLYQAYVQDETNAVISIDQNKLNEVVTLTTDIIDNGPYSLLPNFASKWTNGNDNNRESIFAIQYSADDGTTTGRVDFEHGLNYNLASQYGCCGFHQPSGNLVNAFQTDPDTGLPLFDTFDNNTVRATVEADFQAPHTFDPRLDHTVGIPGHPFKYDPDFVASTAWARAPTIYGYYVTMKEIQHYSCGCLRKTNVFIGTAHNWDVLQFNDVILMKAEALIQLNSGGLLEARDLINRIRTRANNKASVTYPAGHAKAGQGFSNYRADLYTDANLTWNKANAIKALEFERRLEFAMESPRFHDLVRWGKAASVLNGYLQNEKVRYSYLGAAVFTAGRDEYLFIPQEQINLTNGVYIQNPGY